jgi:antagonist of KipI
MADSQTTGGYPRIGQLIQADMPRLAQLQPGQQIQFHEVALATAFAALRKQTQVLQKLQVGCALKFADLHF